MEGRGGLEEESLVDIKVLIERTGISRTVVYEKTRVGHKKFDKEFPQPTYPSKSSPRWINTEISDWIRALKEKRAHRINQK